MRGGKCLKMTAGDIKNVIIFDIFLQYSALEVKEQDDRVKSKLNNSKYCQIIVHHFQTFSG